MAVKTSCAPGVFINEIDRSGYTLNPVGTAVYLKGFTDKGEAYRPMEITTRAAYEQIYGIPNTEAERYTYAAACETLNQNGRLWMARLPYDNASFEKMVGIKYLVKFTAGSETAELTAVDGPYKQVNAADNEIKSAAWIEGGKTPALYDLSAIDEYRTDEARVPANSFLIVDTTGATYSRVQEDTRKGKDREVIGIVPVVTTAANAMYVQSLLSLDNLEQIRNYESLKGQVLSTLKATSADGNVIDIDGLKMENGGLSSTDTVQLFDTDNYFTEVTSYVENVLSVLWPTAQSDISTYSTETEAISARNQYCKDHGYAEDSLQISSWFYEFAVSGEHYEETTAWYIKFEINDNYTTAVTAFTQEELEGKVAEANANASQIAYSCGYDCMTVGERFAHDYLQTWFNGEADQYVNIDSINDKTMRWVPFRKGYRTEAEKDAAVSEMRTLTASYKNVTDITQQPAGVDVYTFVSADFVSCEVPIEDKSDPRYGWHGPDFDDSVPNTLALDAANYFPTVHIAPDSNGFDSEHLKDVGVVVYKAYLDPTEGNKVSLEPVEAYAGSLYKDDKDPNTGVTKFLDTIINTQSKYINFFSNCFTTTVAKRFYKEECDILLARPSIGSCLGLYSPMTKKDISISKSILDGMNKCFDKVEDINKLDIDIVPDAGLANIASYIKAIFGDKGPYDLMVADDLGQSLLGMWTCKKSSDECVKMWKTIELKHDNFCKNIRKDCMFIADGLRPLVLQGQKKIVRDTKPSNSIDKDILPFVQAICGLNTSYGAGYIDWFEQADDYTGDFFWCPPSIKAMGTYINTDVNYEYWDAPAGLNRGRIAAVDVAFSPNGRQANSIYEKNWNYAVDYPQDGIVLEGQKTFQTRPTALDRVNVRRMMLRLERQVYQTVRYFLYENNTAYLRQRVVDAIEPIMKAAWKSGNGGLARYFIKCDEENNGPQVIDNNELKVQIALVPNKSAEQIIVDFIVGGQSSTWAELLG